MKSVLFRCDGNASLGMGHIIGASELAQLMVEHHQIKPIFVIQRDTTVEALLAKKGIDYQLISKDLSLAQEITFIDQIATENDTAHIVFNLAGVQLQRWGDEFKELVKLGRSLFFQDNPTSTFKYADAVLNALPHPDYPGYEPEPHPQCLDGLEYKIWPSAMKQALRNKQLKSRSFCKNDRVLIAMGGSDERNLSLQVIQALSLVAFKGKVDLVLGPLNPHRQAIEHWLGSNAVLDVEVSQAVDDMAERIAVASWGISALGLTTYEMGALGCPAFIIPANQLNAKAADIFLKSYPDFGVVIESGAESLETTDLAQQLDHFMRDWNCKRTLEQSRVFKPENDALLALVNDYLS